MTGLKFLYSRFTFVVAVLVFSLVACNPFVFENVRKKDLKKDVIFETQSGEIVFRLSDETPLHRNNFLKLVNQQFYDSLLFHRVINRFIIQTGDPESKLAKQGKPLGEADLPYTIPAEFSPNLFHKRGALNAARNDNPERASSSTQFTFVQGRIYTDSTINVAEKRINNWLARNRVIHQHENRELMAILEGLISRRNNLDSINLINQQIKILTEKELENSTLYKIPEEQRQVYKTLGGAAHLDQNYTVFGGVVKGMDVIDAIAAVKTDSLDRPVNDVRIISAKLIKRKKY